MTQPKPDIYGRDGAKHVGMGSAYIYSQSLAMAGLGFLFWFFVTKLVPTSEVGEISSLYLFSSLVSVVLTLAIPMVAQRYVPYYSSRGEEGKSVYVARFTLISGSLVSGAVLALSFLFSAQLSQFFLKSSSYSVLIKFYSGTVFLALLSSFASSLLMARQRFGTYAVTQVAYNALYYLLGLFALWKLGNLYGLVFAWTAANLIACLIYLSLSLPMTRGKAEPASVKEMLSYGGPLYAANLISYGAGLIDRYVVLGLGTLSMLGIYNIAISSSGAVSGFMGAALGVTYPFLSGLYGKSGGRPVRSVVKKANKLLTVAYVPMALGSSALAWPVLSLFGKGEYAQGALPLATVLVFSAATLSGGIFANALLAKGKSHAVMLASLASLVTNLAVSALMLKLIGMEGAALGLSISYVSSFFVLAYSARAQELFELDLRTTGLSWASSGAMAAVMIVLEQFLKGPLFIPLYLLAGIASLVFFDALLKPLSRDDLELIEQMMPRRLYSILSGILELSSRRKVMTDFLPTGLPLLPLLCPSSSQCSSRKRPRASYSRQVCAPKRALERHLTPGSPYLVGNSSPQVTWHICQRLSKLPEARAFPRRHAQIPSRLEEPRRRDSPPPSAQSRLAHPRAFQPGTPP
ncbi:MAG: oligosaccharide flippase family protein [TACK group archaeon]|nr:oligosaccharide flippase family protein [TACK group archaeon]